MFLVRRITLLGTCFFSGGSILVIEVCGIRMLAPVFGNALYSWTSLIGIILLAVAAGDYVGGLLIDRVKSHLLIPMLMYVASVSMVLSFLNLKLVGDAVGGSYAWGPMLASFLLFFAPALLLSAVTPISVRLFSLTTSDKCIGLSSGTIGMCSTLGSFTGTILSGFVIVPYTNIEYVLLYLALLLTGLATVFCWTFSVRPKNSPQLIGLLGLLVAYGYWSHVILGPHMIYLKNSIYQRIVVYDYKHPTETTRLLALDHDFSGGIHVEDGSVVFLYQEYWRIIPLYSEHLKRMAFLGAGAFGMPEQLAKACPDSTIDVVELDPDLIPVGKTYFGLDKFANIHAFSQDARRFLRYSPDRYDMVFADCYNGANYIPPHLLTQEFFGVVKEHLNPGGFLMMNLIGAPRGKRDILYQAVIRTVTSVFPFIHVYATKYPQIDALQNVELIASVTPLSPAVTANTDIVQYLKTEIPAGLSPDATLITDYKNPVDTLVARQSYFY